MLGKKRTFYFYTLCVQKLLIWHFHSLAQLKDDTVSKRLYKNQLMYGECVCKTYILLFFNREMLPWMTLVWFGWFSSVNTFVWNFGYLWISQRMFNFPGLSSGTDLFTSVTIVTYKALVKCPYLHGKAIWTFSGTYTSQVYVCITFTDHYIYLSDKTTQLILSNLEPTLKLVLRWP